MKKGEQALVTVSAEYVGSYRASGMVSESSALHYEVQLIDFIKVNMPRNLIACKFNMHVLVNIIFHVH